MSDASDTSNPGRIVLFGDSTSFWTDRGPQARDNPMLFPNVLSEALARRTGRPWHIRVEAHAGWSIADLWRELSREPMRLLVGPGTDVIVLGLGTVDAMTAALPATIMRRLTRVRPRAAERLLRNAIYIASPVLVHLTCGRLRGTSRSEHRAAWAALVATFRSRTPGGRVIAVLPAPRTRGHGGKSQNHHADGVADTAALAASYGVPLLDLPALVAPFASEISAGDGLHWPAHVHCAVGDALADLVVRSGSPAMQPELSAEA